MVTGKDEIGVIQNVAADQTGNNGSSGKQPYKWAAGILAVVVATGAGFTFISRNNGAPSDEAAHAPSRRTDLITLAPEQRAHIVSDVVKAVDLPLRTAVPGKVTFNENRVTPLFAQFGGRVVRLDAEVGMPVRQGQVLGVLDSPDIVGIQSDYQRAQAEHQQALASARTARASLDLATRTRQRAARLAEAEAIPQRELQEAEVAEAHANDELQRTQSAVDAAHSALAALRRKLQIGGIAEEDIERLEKGGASALVRLTPLTAPMSGTIVERNLGLGQVVQAGGDALFRIADLSSVWVNADVYEDQLAGIRPGAQVTIRVPAYPNETFAARVERVASVLDPEKRTVAVRSAIPNSDGRLKPGMFATVDLQSGTIQRAIVVPPSAIVTSAERRTVFVEKEPAVFQQRLIETGNEIGGSVVVRSGLREGERIAVQGALLLSRRMTEARNSQ